MNPNQISQNFVLIFQGRCGSTYLVEALDSHPNIDCEGERYAALKNQKYDAATQIEWARKFLTGAGNAGVLQKGFKTKLRDVLDPNKFKELIQSIETKIIHLRRRNLVKLTISSFNSVRINDKTGDWNVYKSNDRPSSTHIDPGLFASWLDNVEERSQKELAFVESLESPLLTLFYEDFLIDSDGYFESIFRFLDVPFLQVEGRAIKSTSDDLRRAVSNFDELRSNYVGTMYEDMFDEVLF